MRRKSILILTASVCVIMIILIGAALINLNIICDASAAYSGELSGMEPMLPITMDCEYSGDECSICYKLFNIVPIKRVSVSVSGDEVLLGGTPMGIDLSTGGLIVSEKMKVVTDSGIETPMENVDIRVGDVITHVNAVPIENTATLTRVLREHGGSVVLSVRRDDKIIHLPVKAAKSGGDYRLGLYLREGIQGIGTLTFIDKTTKRYGALGHVIKDGETGKEYAAVNGSVYPAVISGVKKGERGKAGELSGYFDNSTGKIGTMDLNCSQGIYGNYGGNTDGFTSVKLGSKYSVHPGKAYIYSTLHGNLPKRYEIEIIKNAVQNESKTRGMLLRVTDKELLTESGGIVQGMSGSPIVQDGRLVGAVTHVFIGDPTKGYGTYIDWMLERARQAG